MGTLITTAVLTLIVLPLIIGGILKAAGASGRMLRKKGGQAVPPDAPKEKGSGLRGLGTWAIAWGIGIVVFAMVAVASSYTQVEAGTVGVVKAFSRSISREVPKSYSAEDLYTQTGQADAQTVIQKRLEEAFGKHGVVIDQYLIRRITFAAEYVAAAEAKQIAEQNALTEQNNIARQEAIKQQTIINAQAEAEKKKIEAAGEAEAIKLKQAAIAQNPLIIQYEFVQKLSPSIQWGVLPDSVVPLLDMKGLTGGTQQQTAP